MNDDSIKQFRWFLKDEVRRTIDFSQTDQNLRIPPPPPEKPVEPGAEIIDLSRPGEWKTIEDPGLLSAIGLRKSVRKYGPDPLSLEELSFLLWATQGIREVGKFGSVFRVVPSAGCRHALETYLCVMNVDGLKPGIYRYLPLRHALVLEREDGQLKERICAAANGQQFTGRAAVNFFWTAIPYRMEWRYHTASAKVIAMDAGHVAQNLYLAVSAIGAGTCAIASYDQKLADELVGADGEDEFVIYLAPVGKI